MNCNNGLGMEAGPKSVLRRISSDSKYQLSEKDEEEYRMAPRRANFFKYPLEVKVAETIMAGNKVVILTGDCTR